MSAPERIWLQDAGDYANAHEVTWCANPQDDADSEYIRKDASDAAIAAARAEGVREGMLKAAGFCQARADQHVNGMEVIWKGGRLHDRLNERRGEATSLRNILLDAAAEAQP